MPTKRKPAKYTPAKKAANSRNTNRRQAIKEDKARAFGFDTASAMDTAIINGEAVVTKVNSAGATRKDKTK